MNVIRTIRDRVASLFLPAVKAGGCVPTVGERCGCDVCRNGDWRGCRRLIDCYGRCRTTTLVGCG